MIYIQPITVPFFGIVSKVEVVLPNYNLTSSADPIISINLYNDREELFRSISQPIPVEIIEKWSIENNYIIDWALGQNKIERA